MEGGFDVSALPQPKDDRHFARHKSTADRSLRGLGAEIARRFATEGSNVAINDLAPEANAQALSTSIQEEYGVKSFVIKGDCGKIEDCQNCVHETIRQLGGIDIIVGNAAYTKFSNFANLDALTYEEWDNAFHTNVLGNHALFKEALPTFNSNPEGGVFIVTSSVVGKATAGSSMAYSVTKCALLHLIKCLAATQGPKVRINAVLPGLMLTEWGSSVGDEAVTMMKQQAVLKKESDIEDVADMYVNIARNASMTGQFVHVGEYLIVSS